jgi:hypothetical protein
MAMAMVWAPQNVVNCFVFLVAFYRVIARNFEIPILVFALLYIALEVFLVLWAGFAISSALLHLSGAAVGFVLGTILLKKDWVDCENWDLFAVMQRREGRTRQEAARVKRGPAPPPRKKVRRAEKEADNPKSIEDRNATALRRLRGYLDAGETEAAQGAYDKAMRTVPGWQPPDPDWLDLIKALNAEKMWPASVSVMEDYLRRSSDPSPRVRLKLAQILIKEQQRPAHALRVLGEIPPNSLPESLDSVRQQLTRQAEQMREDGVLELEGEAW